MPPPISRFSVQPCPQPPSRTTATHGSRAAIASPPAARSSAKELASSITKNVMTTVPHTIRKCHFCGISDNDAFTKAISWLTANKRRFASPDQAYIYLKALIIAPDRIPELQRYLWSREEIPGKTPTWYAGLKIELHQRMRNAKR